ncbi:hypothetical protein [Yinghuangia seranimata]|uniref:hypothetical protein n=1 Tax=Yinghuangia seranimata TaxID=408067 RepID=UPI00248B1B86|nr:hypothetical protein [Yinghuangia seranimata]MDI2129633.1 hypothetical protein [Yinghuangia seranimata]
MNRPDLLALTADTLAALTNRGLVKRAAKELEAGAGADVTLADDGAVRGVFADGTRTELPPGGGLDTAVCTCGATGVCRHVLGVVLAYQRANASNETGNPAEASAERMVPTTREGSATAARGRTPAPTSATEAAASEASLKTPVRDAAPSHPALGSEADTPASAALPDGSALAVPGRSAPATRRVGTNSTASPASSASGTAQGQPAVPRQATASERPVPTERGAGSGSALPSDPTDTAAATTRAGVVPDPATLSTPAHAWSPGDVPDTVLAELFGARTLTDARRTLTRGYRATVHRPAPGDPPETSVELPTCTVRFPVPGELAYALTDASAQARAGVIVLAVWACRAADEARPGEGSVALDVGGATRVLDLAPLGAVLGEVDALLVDGLAHVGPVGLATLRRHRDALAGAGLHWPADAVGELVDQAEAYAERAARHRPERCADLVAELHARRRASAGPDILGAREAGETALRRVRLVSLGCRVGDGGRPDDERSVEVYFAHPSAGVVLVWRRAWPNPADQPPPAGPDLAARRVFGSTLGVSAAANILTERAVRTAGRVVTIGASRVAPTSVTPLSGRSWAELPEPLLVRDFTACRDALAARPPEPVRPRVAADAVRVLEVSAVGEVWYDAAAQCVEAELHDAHGNTALLSAPYNPYAPGGSDALEAALRDGDVRRVSGEVRRSGGRLVVDPVAVETAQGVLVPDLAAGVPRAAPTGPPVRASDPLGEAIAEARAVLAEAARQGLRHLDAAALQRVDEAAAGLARIGLAGSAAALRAFAAAWRTSGYAGAVQPWVDARLHLWVAAELHDAG